MANPLRQSVTKIFVHGGAIVLAAWQPAASLIPGLRSKSDGRAQPSSRTNRRARRRDDEKCLPVRSGGPTLRKPPSARARSPFFKARTVVVDIIIHYAHPFQRSRSPTGSATEGNFTPQRPG